MAAGSITKGSMTDEMAFVPGPIGFLKKALSAVLIHGKFCNPQ